MAQAGKIPKKKTRMTDSTACQFCAEEFHDRTDDLHEHEDTCAPTHISRYVCPSREGCEVDCCYFSITKVRALRHARSSQCPMLDIALKPMPEEVMEIIMLRAHI